MNYLVKGTKREVSLQPTMCKCEFCHSSPFSPRFVVDNDNLLSDAT